MIIDQKLNLIHLVQYEAKIYFVDKDILDREKMRAKVYIDFMINYHNIKIWLIYIFSQRKVLKTRDIIFDEDSHYQSYEINTAQLINESFLKNDTLKILQNNFTKFIKIESNSDEKLFKLTSTETFVVYSSNDKKTKKTINKDDRRYLSSSTSSFLKEENTLQSFSKQFQLSETIFTSFSRIILHVFTLFAHCLTKKTFCQKIQLVLKSSIRVVKHITSL